MRLLNARVTVVAILLFSGSYAQKSQPQLLTHKKCIIPFTLTSHNNIVIQMVLNSTDTLQLMVHTAESDVTLTEDAAKKIKSVAYTGQVTGVKSWGGSDNSSRFSENNMLQMGNMQWDSVTVWEDKNSGQGTDGKIGLNLFEGRVIAIDYDKKLLTISEQLPRRVKHYQQCALVHKREDLFIQGNCITGSDTSTNQFLIHSGYSGDVLLDDKFAADNHLGDKLQVTGEKQLKDAYGNIVKTKRVLLPAFAIGSNVLTNVPAGFFEGNVGRQKMSIIGADILKRFNLIIDARREYIYLQPSRLKDDEYAKA